MGDTKSVGLGRETASKRAVPPTNIVAMTGAAIHRQRRIDRWSGTREDTGSVEAPEDTEGLAPVSRAVERSCPLALPG